MAIAAAGLGAVAVAAGIAGVPCLGYAVRPSIVAAAIALFVGVTAIGAVAGALGLGPSGNRWDFRSVVLRRAFRPPSRLGHNSGPRADGWFPRHHELIHLARTARAPPARGRQSHGRSRAQFARRSWLAQGGI